MDARNSPAELEVILRRTLPPEDVPDESLRRFAILTGLLIEAQGRLNLTAVREPEAMAVAHFADSLAGLRAEPMLRAARRAADIGPGGGFPVLPLATMLPECHWYAIESVAKKCRFIEEAARAMELRNVTAECLRAEEAGRGPLRHSLDVVTARAVGPVASLVEVGLPLLRAGGRLLLYKTEAAQGEWQAALPVLGCLGARPLEEFRYRFPGDRQERIILRAELVRPVPEKYPRANGVPFKKPLAAG